MQFGRNFIKARNLTKLDQKDAAAALDISPAFLSKVENDKKRPSIDLILKAAEFYGVKAAFFFEEQEEIDIESLKTQKNQKFIQNIDSMSLEELQEKYRFKLDGKDLSEKELKGIMAYIRSLRSIED